MFVSGFSFIKNAIKYDYPIMESIQSVLPLCDEFVVAVGNSEDNTKDLIKGIDSAKIKIIDTVWDGSLREGGRVLAVETEKAYAETSNKADWCFYIQGDEVLHEKYIEPVQKSMKQWKDNKKVEGLVFGYQHFYGSYDYVGNSRRWYKNEVRVIRKDKNIYSFRDAQGFQKNNRPLRVKKANATIYHYGWVKHPKHQQEKQKSFNKLWHNDDWVKQNVKQVDEFDYSNIDSLKKFTETHPKVMQQRINSMNWQFSFDPTHKKTTFKNRLLEFIRKRIGWDIGVYRNYKLLK